MFGETKIPHSPSSDTASEEVNLNKELKILHEMTVVATRKKPKEFVDNF